MTVAVDEDDLPTTVPAIARSFRVILMKIISERPRGVADAEAIVRRRIGDLDLAYFEPRIRELATALESDAILNRWRTWTGD